MDETNEGLREYLALDDDELLERLGDQLLGPAPGFGPSDFERKLRFAQSWLNRRMDDLRRDVCGDVWTNLQHGGGFDAMTDAAAIADALAAALGRPTANIVAVILLRRGLRSICD